MVETLQPSADEAETIEITDKAVSSQDAVDGRSEVKEVDKLAKLQKIVNLNIPLINDYFGDWYSGQVVFDIDDEMFLINLSRVSPNPTHQPALSNWRIENVTSLISYEVVSKMEIERLLQEEHGITLSDIVKFRLSAGKLR